MWPAQKKGADTVKLTEESAGDRVETGGSVECRKHRVKESE